MNNEQNKCKKEDTTSTLYQEDIWQPLANFLSEMIAKYWDDLDMEEKPIQHVSDDNLKNTA